jgi:tRNA-dihydrouridine synthase
MTFWNSLPTPVIGLSPMDGVTDSVFRLMTARQGKPDVIFTEFTHVHDVCRGPEFLLDSLDYDEAERPVVAQLYGKDPELFYQAAHAVCELGFDGLDINMGCPSHNVASSGSGAGLIRTPGLAHEIMRAARQGIADWTAGRTLQAAGLKAARVDAFLRLNGRRNRVPAAIRSPIPLSVKTRLGYDEVIVERWIEHLLLESPAVISLHGRTLKQMYKGEADWAAIERAARVVRGSGTLLFGNGDVQNLSEVVQRVRETGVDGVLVGRRDGIRRRLNPGRWNRGRLPWPAGSTAFSRTRGNSRCNGVRTNSDGCESTWAGTARDSHMRRPSGPACSVSLPCRTSKPSSPIFGAANWLTQKGQQMCP